MGWLDNYRIGTAKNGKWLQGAINPEHKGYCTPITKSTCTGHRKAFAKMMKKKHGFHKAEDGDQIKAIAPEDAVLSNYWMQKNLNKNFVQRAYQDNPQSIQVPGEKGRSTHLMSYSWNEDNGSNTSFVYPEVVEQNGQLVHSKNPYQQAMSTREYIEVPTNKAEMFSSIGYKKASKIPVKKQGGKVVAADGMTIQSVTDRERDQWERVQTAAYQQGYQGNDHNKQMGNDFLKSQGFDPGRLGAIQQDFLNLQGTGRVNAPAGYSPNDQFYGHKTAQQRYKQYQVVEPTGKTTNYGSNATAASGDVNNFLHPKQQPIPWQSNDQNIPMDAPQAVLDKRFGPSTAKVNKSSFYDGTQSEDSYSIDAIRNNNQLEYEFSKGGKIGKKKKSMKYC